MEVHPPDHPIHTWRDFFIHIATIVVGLVIALGLEQLVVQIDHHHEIKETRERLKAERESNIRRYHRDISNMRDTVAILHGDVRILQYLKAHPGTPADQLPGIPVWILSTAGIDTSAWDWTVKSPVFELLPQSEVEPTQRLYEVLKDSEAKHMEMWDCLNEAGDYRFIQPDISKLTPQQIDLALTRSQSCLRMTYQYVATLSSIARSAPDFAPGPSNAEMQALGNDAWDNILNGDKLASWVQQDQIDAHKWDNYDAALLAFKQAATAGSYDNIAQIYDEVARKYPSFKPDESELNQTGYEQMNAGHLPQALGIFQLVARLYPSSWNAYDSLGEAYRKSGDTQQAIANYEKSLQLNPKNTNGAKALSELKK